MYGTAKERTDALKACVEMPVIEQIYIESHSMKVVRPNVLNERLL